MLRMGIGTDKKIVNMNEGEEEKEEEEGDIPR